MKSAPTISALTTSIRLLWPFLQLARKHGYDVSKIGERLGLSDAELADPETRVPQRLIAQLLDEAIQRSGERDLGLLAARWVDSRHFGIGEYVARTQPTLRAAADLYGRYLPLLGDGAGLSIEPSGRNLILRLWFGPDLMFADAAYEFAVAIGVLRARRITGLEELAPVSIHFAHPRPANTSRHERLFRCPVHFGADGTYVVVSRRALELKLPGAEPQLSELLARQADAMLETLPRKDDVSTRVRALLGGELKLSSASVPRVAKRLGMSVRTLARKLDSEHTSFRALLDEARKQVALRELSQGRRTLSEIADRLGFASTQGFHRAFKRWTGTTAGRVRARRGR